MQEAKANPVKGLPLLQRALDRRGNAGQEESAKRNVPHVFELLPKAIGSLKMKDKRAVVAAGSVIERCVQLFNDPSIGAGSPPTLDPAILVQCISQFTPLLQKAHSQGRQTYRTDFKDIQTYMEDKESSMVATAIAGAIKALFRLEDHAAACRQEFAKSGLKIAVTCVKNDSGLTRAARQEFLTMFGMLLKEPERAQDFICNQGIFVLLPYCALPGTPRQMFAVSKEFQLLCTGLLEKCVKNGKGIDDEILDEVQAAIQKVTQDPEVPVLLGKEIPVPRSWTAK